MIKKEKWIVDEDDELRLFYGDENFNGSAYPCNDIVFMKMIADKLNKLEEENEQLKEALREQLQDNGNSYYIDLFDELFNLNYGEWNKNEPYRECIDWEKLKGVDVE